MPATHEKKTHPEETVKRESNFARSVTVLALACTVIALLLLGIMALKIYEPWGLLSQSRPGATDSTSQRLRQTEALQKLQETRLALLEARIAYLESKDTSKVIRRLNEGIAALDNLGKISTGAQKIRADKLRTDFKATQRDIERDPKTLPAGLDKLSLGLEELEDYYTSVVLPEK